MKFAIVNGERREAEKGLNGTCPGCGAAMVAKCGEIKISHWAHQGKRMCDPWWENETEWHRTWKGQFPVAWQEIVHHAEDGEKHIADVKTKNGWVLEFQHSFLNPEERRTRSTFYPKLVWIVDATRRERDRIQFNKALEMSIRIVQRPIVLGLFADDCALLREWGGLSSPVLFDFGEPENLWCMLPVATDGKPYIILLSRKQFVDVHRSEAATAGQNFETVIKSFTDLISDYLLQKERMEKRAAMQNDPLTLLNHYARQTRYRRRYY